MSQTFKIETRIVYKYVRLVQKHPNEKTLCHYQKHVFVLTILRYVTNK